MKYIKDTIVVLSETKSHNKSIQFGLSRRVNRPGGGGRGHGSWQIMPFPRNIYNDQFIFVGNPFLEPEYSTQYDLKYSTPIPTGFASLNIFTAISMSFSSVIQESSPIGLSAKPIVISQQRLWQLKGYGLAPVLVG